MRWLASVHESIWHASSGCLTAACGHELCGPVHGRPTPPSDPQRAICGACVQAIGYVDPTPARALLADAPTRRRRDLSDALEAFPYESDGEPIGEPLPDPLEAIA